MCSFNSLLSSRDGLQSIESRTNEHRAVTHNKLTHAVDIRLIHGSYYIPDTIMRYGFKTNLDLVWPTQFDWESQTEWPVQLTEPLLKSTYAGESHDTAISFFVCNSEWSVVFTKCIPQSATLIWLTLKHWPGFWQLPQPRPVHENKIT